jgi:hypothetical protein
VTGDAEKDNRQKTKHIQSWRQVSWALGWRHTSLLHLQQVYCIQWQNEVERQFSGRRLDIVILGNRRNLRLLLSELNILGRKHSCSASCPLLQLMLCQLKSAIYWA